MKGPIGIEGVFGADITKSAKGKHGIMTKFRLKDGKVRSVKFWYMVK